MSNRIPLPSPALTQHPSGNVYFSPQQMHAHAEAARQAAMEEAAKLCDATAERWKQGSVGSGVHDVTVDAAESLAESIRELGKQPA